jgi:fermentation-respiration switch protein FrsA (DUF1100 family)
VSGPAPTHSWGADSQTDEDQNASSCFGTYVVFFRYPRPVLALRGGKEPRVSYPAEQVAEACRPRATLVAIPAADHFYFYNGTQAELARAVCDWLATIGG